MEEIRSIKENPDNIGEHSLNRTYQEKIKQNTQLTSSSFSAVPLFNLTVYSSD